MTKKKDKRGKGKGWHGDSAGHSAAARKSWKGKSTHKTKGGKKKAVAAAKKRYKAMKKRLGR